MAATSPASPDLAAATQHCVLTSWAADVWRLHSPRFAADNTDGSLLFTGRFHRGLDQYPVEETWPALYTSLDKAIPLAEKLRHTNETTLHKLRRVRLSRLSVVLGRVLVLCQPEEFLQSTIAGVPREAMCADEAFCHHLAIHARTQAEAILVPSCTGVPGGNLVIFSDLKLPSSMITVTAFHDLNLGEG